MPTILRIDRARLASEMRASARLATPLILGQLSAIGMNSVDALLAGHLNAHTLAAVAVATSVWALAIVASIGVMLSVPPSVAQLNGAHRRADIAPLFAQAIWLALALGVVLGLAIHFAGPLLPALIGVDARLTEDVGAFLRAIAFGAPALALFASMRGLSEGLGLGRPTMYFALLGPVLLAPLGYVLMYGRLGVPSLGALGAAIATAIVLWVQVFAFATYLLRSRHFRDLNLLQGWARPDPRTIGELLHIGLPMGVTLLMEGGLFVAVALIIGRLGTDIVASHQVALNVASIAFMVPLGMALATTVRVGNAVGRNDAIGVRHAALASFALTLGTQFFSAGLMATLPTVIASLYTSDAAVIALAGQLLLLAAIFQLSDGIQVVANGALRGLKDTRIPMVISLVAYWGFGMPVGWWLTFRLDMGARGMWIGLIAGLSAAAILLTTRFWRMSGRLARVNASAPGNVAA
ncbi:MAG: MATE family efflux transporter [Dokdonella sp.]